MIIGRFGNTSGRPHMEGRIILPRFNLHANISFIVDTGADKTVLMPMDAFRMALDYTQLTNIVDTIGVGGVAKDYVERALVVFFDAAISSLHVYNIDLHISSPSPDTMTIPCLLGRDVIDNWALTVDRMTNTLTGDVRRSDITIPVPPLPLIPSAPPLLPSP